MATEYLAKLDSYECRQLAIDLNKGRQRANQAGISAAYPYSWAFLEMAGEITEIYFDTLNQMYRALIRETDEFIREQTKWHVA